MKVKNIILIFLLIIIITAIVLYHIKFKTKYQFGKFMGTLGNKVRENASEKNESNPDEIIHKFEEIFCRYTDNNGLSRAFPQMVIIVILIITIIELSLLVIIQLPKTCCGCCKEFFSFIFIFHSLFDMIIYEEFARMPAEVKLEKEQIYSFDEEFNKEIKTNLDFMKSRKIYLIVCVFVAILGIIGELVIVILNLIDDCKKNKIKPQVVYVENSKVVNNEISIESENNIN